MNREKIDPKNMFKFIFDFPNQIEKAVVIGKNIGLRKNYSKVNKIVLAGMGGSAVGGDLLSKPNTAWSSIRKMSVMKLPFPAGCSLEPQLGFL